MQIPASMTPGSASPYPEGSEDSLSGRSLEEALARERETAERLAQILEMSGDAAAEIDREWNVRPLNGRARRLFGSAEPAGGWREFFESAAGPASETLGQTLWAGVSGEAESFFPEPLRGWFAVRSQATADGMLVWFRDITESRTQAYVVQGQQERLEQVQWASRAATWELDLSTERFAYGAGAYPVFGHPLHEVESLQALARILEAGHADAVARGVQEAVETGESTVMEFAVRSANGSTIWLESRAQATVRSGAGSRLRGMFFDITERKRRENELVASEARYRVLTDKNPLAIWSADPQGRITYANKVCLWFAGVEDPEQVKDITFLATIAPEERKLARDQWRTAMEQQSDFDAEYRFRDARTGEFRWWHLRAAPVRDASGAVFQWLGVGQDVHEARMYAEALRSERSEAERKRAELETIYRTSPVGLALIDPVELRFLNLNDQEAEMLGYPKSELIGRPLAEIAPEDKLPGLLDMMREVAGGRAIRDRLLEGELVSRPGERRAWNVNYSPVFNEDGSVRAISTASIEITNLKRAEAALVRSEKLAAVGRLASSISHEINNPLEAITNLLYLVAMDERLPEPLKPFVGMAQSELGRVSQIATQTLRFHRQAMAPTPVTPEELLSAVIRLYTGRLANSNIEVDARYATSTKILCFESDIRQVLNNLIANAIDAMRGGGRLMVRAHAATCKGSGGALNGVRFTIADTGHGMSREVQSRLFEPFFTTKDLQGTGLGLWISKGIVERHQGRLTVRSCDRRERHGTVFTLFLPCEEV